MSELATRTGIEVISDAYRKAVRRELHRLVKFLLWRDELSDRRLEPEPDINGKIQCSEESNGRPGMSPQKQKPVYQQR